MPTCSKCLSMVSPDFFDEDSTTKICHFCKENTEILHGPNGEVYIKGEMLEDYRKLLNRLKNSENIQKKATELYIDSEVKKYNSNK